MHITINGTQHTIAAHSTTEAMLKTLGLRDKPCAVEVNAVLVPKARHASTVLHEGDVVEIVTLVGGG
jgi:sulfur carrier protein